MYQTTVTDRKSPVVTRFSADFVARVEPMIVKTTSSYHELIFQGFKFTGIPHTQHLHFAPGSCPALLSSSLVVSRWSTKLIKSVLLSLPCTMPLQIALSHFTRENVSKNVTGDQVAFYLINPNVEIWIYFVTCYLVSTWPQLFGAFISEGMSPSPHTLSISH